jgi:hypothetical protein
MWDDFHQLFISYWHTSSDLPSQFRHDTSVEQRDKKSSGQFLWGQDSEVESNLQCFEAD